MLEHKFFEFERNINDMQKAWLCSILPPVSPIPPDSKSPFSSDTYVSCMKFGIHVRIIHELFLVRFDYRG